MSSVVVFGGLSVIVLTTGRKDRGFKPGREQQIFISVKIHSTLSLREEVKSSVVCRKSLRHIKHSYSINCKKKSHTFLSKFLLIRY
jgi:hypothetical protein